MTKRAKFITALVAAIGLVVVAPLSAVAYWVVSAQLAVTAQASTFSIAPFAMTPNASSFQGWTGTTYHSAPMTNNGATPWAAQSVTITAASGFGPAAVATVQVAFATSAGACTTDATYTSVTPQSALATSTWSATATVAPAATRYACVKLVVTNTDTSTASGAGAPAPTLTLTTAAKASQANWTAQNQASLTVSSTGWAACTTDGQDAILTLPTAVPAGTYTIERVDSGATFTGSVSASAPTTLALTTNPAPGTEAATETYVRIKNSGGTTVAVANVTFRSYYVLWIFLQKTVNCA